MPKNEKFQNEYGRFETALRQVLSAPKQKVKLKGRTPKSKNKKP